MVEKQGAALNMLLNRAALNMLLNKALIFLQAEKHIKVYTDKAFQEYHLHGKNTIFLLHDSRELTKTRWWKDDD
jgi:hypothetical protein